MNKRDLEKFKKLLLKKRDEIIGGMKHITDENLSKSQREASGDLSGYAYHMADMASDNYEREFLLGLATGEREILLAVDEALKKIQDNTYGRCEGCRENIKKDRLLAIPYATCCLECQSKQEKRRTT
jgi:RNA polymerase-binding protein DksA